jgi:hypothetical protein
MDKEQLQKEYNLLLEVITDLELRLAEEEERFLSSGERSIAAQTWRMGTKITLLNYKADLVQVSKELRKLEEPDELLKQLMRGISLHHLLTIWWNR